MRYSILYVSPIVLINICKKGKSLVEVIENAIPSDSEFVRYFLDDTHGYGNIGIVIESSKFRELKDNEVIPILPYPVFNKVK